MGHNRLEILTFPGNAKPPNGLGLGRAVFDPEVLPALELGPPGWLF